MYIQDTEPEYVLERISCHDEVKSSAWEFSLSSSVCIVVHVYSGIAMTAETWDFMQLSESEVQNSVAIAIGTAWQHQLIPSIVRTAFLF